MQTAPPPPSEFSKFSVLWNNDWTTHNRPMSRHTVILRQGGQGGLGGLTCNELFLDQVHVIFRPSKEIGQGEFIAGDDATYSFRPETSQLMVRTRPGEQHVFYISDHDVAQTMSDGKNHRPAIVYSSALHLLNEVVNNESYWCRTYKPMRDLPIASELHNVSEMDIELIFPLLVDNPVTNGLHYVPDYRILTVYCEFSIRS